MMFDTWDGKIWYPRFYDMDTICSYDNSGQIKFDVDVEMEQGYWNTSSSRLWTKIRDWMHDDLVEIYKDMRQNGLSFENLMKYFYDDQISVIPQTYYNKDADIKYIPYADQYIGKAHGDGYQHLKRWLKRRITFCDTLFDYTPSYTNDILTIRANTTEEMTLEIETYTPVYQHLSWYNNQMDKKKINGKTSVTFTGTAQASTDQEILIYGGSNIKAIRGISSTNPNQVLIGSATRLTEIDLSNCPILTTVNSDKANFTPHTYLNKLDISNCPQLGGILKANNSPLLREINAKNTAVIGIQLPPSIRNLEVLRLPNSISTLTLNDAGLLNTLEFDEGVNLQSISLTNCNNLTNCINFDLTKTPTVLLDNSYNAEELYMSETTNLTLKNMPTLKRVIYTPNNEYAEFDINNVINGKSYKVTTFNNPNMKEFITTADNRLSNAYRSKVTRVIDYIEGDGTAYLNTRYTPKSNTKIVLDAQIDNNKQYGHWLGCEGQNKIQWDNSGALISNNWTITPTTNLTTRQTYTITATESTYELLLFCGYYNNALETNYIGKGKIYSMKIYEGDTLVHDYIPAMNGHIVTLYDNIDNTYLEVVGTLLSNYRIIYPDITPNTVFSANTLDLSDTQFTDIKFLCTTDLYNLKVPTTMKNFYCDSAMDIDTEVVTDASYEFIHDEIVEQYTTNYGGEVVKVVTNSINIKDNSIANKKINIEYSEQYQYDNYVVTGELDDSSYYMTDYIKVTPGTKLTVPYVDFGQDIKTVVIAGYPKDKSVGYRVYNLNSYSIDFNYTIPSWMEWIKASTDCDRIIINYEGTETPNIIPSSASGSLIFNLYSNNTTQPTSTSPYMWDLTGLKLNDFYTFGMNNWVKPNDGAIISVATEKVTIFPNNSWRGSLGNKILIGTDNGSPFGALSPLKVKQGDSIKVNIQQTFKYAIIDSQGIILAETINTGAWSPIDTVVEITQENADRLLIQAYPSGSPVSEVYFNDITFYTNTLTLTDNDTNNNETAFSLVVESMDAKNQLINLESITMPQRLPGYSVRMVNADITPNNYANHLYPLLVDTTLPIIGKLDYSKYQGTSLAWAYAYTTNDVAITPLGSQHMGGITNDYNKLYGTDYVDIVDVWAYKDDDFSNKSTNEAITKAYIELTSSNYKTRIDEVLQWYPNCTDLYLFDDGSVTSLESMFYNNNTTYKTRIQNVTFIEGYFENVTKMTSGFYECSSLISITNIPNSITTYNSCFMNCTSLTTVSNIPNSIESSNTTFKNCSNLTSIPIDGWKGSLYQTFYNCTSLNQQINISSTTSLEGTFYGCSSLTTAPTIPNSVTTMESTFSGCKSLTTPPTIPDNVVNMNSTFQNCTSLTTPPTIPNGVTSMANTFYGCSALTTPPTIPDNVVNMNSTFQNCTSFTVIDTTDWDTSNVTNMSGLFYGCSNLTEIKGIENWNTSKVTDVWDLFYGCSSIEYMDLSQWDMSNMTSTGCMYRHCSSLRTAYLPIQGGVPDNALENCRGDLDVVWVGERTTDFNLSVYGHTNGFRAIDIQELVPEHLYDLLVNKLTIVNKTGTLNDTYSATTNCAVGNFIIGSYSYYSTTEFYPGTCRMYKAILNGVEIIPILDESGNPCFLNTQNNSKYYNEKDGGILTAGTVVSKHGQYDKLDHIMAVGAIVRANDITVEDGTHNLEYYFKSADAHTMNTHIVNQMVFDDNKNNPTNFAHSMRAWQGSGYGNPLVDSDGNVGITKSANTIDSSTLTLGETYLAYLTEEEITSAVAKGWTLQ